MVKNKKQVSYVIDEKTLKLFNKKAKECSINKSLLIENLIKGWMKENDK